MNASGIPGVLGDDQRELDVVISRLPIYAVKTVLADATLRSPLTGAGLARPGASREAGATFHGARMDKARAYPELHVQQSRFAFPVLASETGGRSSDECHALIAQLARARARLHNEAVRGATRAMYTRRSYSMLSIGVQKAVAANFSGVDNVSFQNINVHVDFEELCTTCVNLSDVSRLPMN